MVQCALDSLRQSSPVTAIINKLLRSPVIFSSNSSVSRQSRYMPISGFRSKVPFSHPEVFWLILINCMMIIYTLCYQPNTQYETLGSLYVNGATSGVADIYRIGYY